MTAPQDTAVRRSLRRLTLGSGPLKRRSDRVQVAGRLLLALSFLLAPVAAVTASSAVSAQLRSVAADQAAERSQTRAVLLEDAPGPTAAAGPGSAGAVPARVTWAGPRGTREEGTALVPPRAEAGTAVEVWVDREGHRTLAPLDPRGIPAQAGAMGGVTLVGIPLVTWLLYVALCTGLDRHRERGWAREWAAVEPDWRSRLL
ncbi:MULTISPECIES: Rv1733c family protein [unclassified Blastococcus]